MRKVLLSLPIALIGLVTINISSIFAANSTIVFSPQTGSFDKPFTVSLVIDGRGDRFNASQAKVTLSENLAIQDLTLGDCNFSYLSTPSKENPSFEGIILSSYSSKCTVYSLKLAPVATGKATITISNASVRQYGDAAEILSKAQNAIYTLTKAQNKSTVNAQASVSQDGLYTVSLKVLSTENVPANNANIKLESVSKDNQRKGVTNDNGEVQFVGLPEGVYDVIVEKDGTKVGEAIINVSGPNKVLTLGINLEAQKNNPLLKDKNSIINKLIASPVLLISILLVGLILGVSIALLAMKFISSRKKKS